MFEQSFKNIDDVLWKEAGCTTELDYTDELRFRSQQEKHELSHLYEAKIKNMGNAGRNGGEYYTSRLLIRAMIQVMKPKIGDRIYDGACGSATFAESEKSWLVDVADVDPETFDLSVKNPNKARRHRYGIRWKFWRRSHF